MKTRRRKTLGRGMRDLVGTSLEGLVQGSEKEKPAARDRTETPSVPSPAPAAEPEAAAGEAAPVAAEGAGTDTRVVAVASGKGGTGKSLLAVNIAISMAARHRVCLVDADFGLANAHILMGLLPRYNVSHLISGERSLEEVLLTGPRGVRLLPGASGVPEMASLDDAGLDRFAVAVGPLMERCDRVVLDCPAGLSRHSLLFLHGADVVIVVTTEDVTSMTDAYALIKTVLAHRPHAVVGLVVNDARSSAEGAETYRKVCHVARKFLGRDLLSLGTVPRDPCLERSVMERRPVVLGHPKSPSSLAISDLATRLDTLERSEPAIEFPRRIQVTLAASALMGARGSKNGDRPCES